MILLEQVRKRGLEPSENANDYKSRKWVINRNIYLRYWKYYFVWDIENINSRRTVRVNIGVDTSPKPSRTKWSKSISTSIHKALQVLQKLILENLLHYIPSEQESSGAVNNILHSKYARQLYKFSTQNRCSKFPCLFW